MKDISLKIDQAGELDELIKKYSGELKALKAELKTEAEKRKKKVLQGSEYICTFSTSSRSKAEPKALLRLLKKIGMEKKFVEMVRVDITNTRRIVGDSADKVIKQVSDSFGRISFTKK